MNIPPFHRRSLITYGFLTVLSAASVLRADTYFWQESGTNTNWSVLPTDTNWLIDNTGSLVPWIDLNDAVFQGNTNQTINLNGTLNPASILVDSASNLTWNHSGGDLTGSGTLTKRGTGVLTLTGDSPNSRTGSTQIEGGIVSLGTGGTGAPTSHVGALGSGPVSVTNGGALRYWIKNDALHTFTHQVTLNQGTLLSEDGNNVLTGDLVLDNGGGTINVVYDNKNFTHTGLISGNGQLTKTGAGTLHLLSTNPNTYTGGTLIQGGTVSIGTGGTGADTSHVQALGTGDVRVTSNGTLKYWIQNIGPHTFTNNVALDQGTLLSEDGNNILQGNLEIGAGGGTVTVVFDNKNLTHTGNITGPGRLEKTGSGTLHLLNTSANTFSGGTLINGGMVSVGSGGTGSDTSHVQALGTGEVRVNLGGTVRYWIKNDATHQFTNTHVLDGGTLLSEDGNNVLTNNLYLLDNGGTLVSKWADKTLTVEGPISGHGTLNISHQAGGTHSTINLNGANSHTGVTHVNSGAILKVGNQSALGQGGAGSHTQVNHGGTLDINGFALNGGATPEQIFIAGDGNGRGAVINTGAPQTNALGNLTLTDNATLSGSNRFDVRRSGSTDSYLNLNGFTLTKEGAADVYLVNLNQGISDGSIVVNNGNLGIEGNTWADVGTGRVTVNGSGTLSFYERNQNEFQRAIDLNGGVLRGQNNLNTVHSDIAVLDNSTILSEGSGNLILHGDLSGASGTNLNKTGTGQVVIAGNGSFAGTTQVQAGTLQVGLNGSGSNGPGEIQVQQQARLTGSGRAGGNVVVQDQGVFAPGETAASNPLQVGGNLTLQSGSQFEMSSIFGPGEVITEVETGNVSLDGSILTGVYGGDIQSGNSAPTLNDVLWLVNNTGSGTLDGKFQNGESNALWQSILGSSSVDVIELNGQNLAVVYGADFGSGFSGGNDIAIFAVDVIPEPSRAILFILSALPVVFLRRR